MAEVDLYLHMLVVVFLLDQRDLARAVVAADQLAQRAQVRSNGRKRDGWMDGWMDG